MTTSPAYAVLLGRNAFRLVFRSLLKSNPSIECDKQLFRFQEQIWSVVARHVFADGKPLTKRNLALEIHRLARLPFPWGPNSELNGSDSEKRLGEAPR